MLTAFLKKAVRSLVQPAFLAALAGVAMSASQARAQDPANGDSAGPGYSNAVVIYAYQRIGEDEYPGSSLRLEQFEEQLNELQTGGYNVIGLDDAVRALKEGAKLPDKSVVLTFGGGHRSIWDHAVPRLLNARLPFSVFVPTDPIDWESPNYMTWKQLRELHKKGVTVGIHGADYEHMVNMARPEVLESINRAAARFREELDFTPQYFAYPFGEYSKALQTIISEWGFAAAFGQQSGVAYDGSDMSALPRFTMIESYGDLERFQLTANALPLPVHDVIPIDNAIKDNPPNVGFTVDKALKSLDGLSCFATGQGRTKLEKVENHVELRLSKPLLTDRARINCTMPAEAYGPFEEPRWRWFGMMFAVPQKNEQALIEE